MSRFADVTPRLPVADLQRTIAFYQDALGFRADMVWPDHDPKFALLKRNNVTLGFFVPMEGQPNSIGYAELYIEVEDAQSLHAQLSNHLAIEWGPEVYSYGRREFAIRDPDSYLVIFTEPTDEPATADES